MKVVILCGGLGTRIREETEFRPKPMVEIGNRPVLWHIMKLYAAQGYREFVLCLGYKGEMIKEFFFNYEMLNYDFTVTFGGSAAPEVHKAHDEVGWRVTLADTGQNTLKGGRLKAVERYIDGDIFMVTYGDGVADIDMRELEAFHRSHGKMATVTGVNAHARFGRLLSDGDAVVKFAEKPTEPDDMVSGGFFVFNREFLERLQLQDACDLEYGPLEDLAAEGELMVYRHQGFWAPMDTIRDAQYLNQLWDSGNAPWKVW